MAAEIKSIIESPPMTFPETAKEAFQFVSNLAAKEGVPLYKYCRERGVDPSTLTLWKSKRKSYNMATLIRLMKK